jgi:hypothetical protein
MAVYVPLASSKPALLPNSGSAGPIDPSEIARITVCVRSAGETTPVAVHCLLTVSGGFHE